MHFAQPTFLYGLILLPLLALVFFATHQEPGETALACAVREVEEELRVTPTGVQPRGELRFQFLDGYGIHVFVFSADGCDRVARETEEAVPLWTQLGEIPYAEMWEDDRIWLPLLLAGETFSGRFVFDGDAMLDAEVDVLSAALR